MKNLVLRPFNGRLSIEIDKKPIMVIGILSLLLLTLIIISLSIGSTIISPVVVFQNILNLGETEYDFIINTLRFPRIILSVLVGSALGVSGLILQGIVRNPLGSPDIVGITGGASFTAVLFITYFLNEISISLLPFITILGALFVSIIIYLLSWNKGITPIRLVLIGIGISALMNALTTMMLVLGNAYTTSQAYLWLTGSVYGATWSDVITLLPWVAIFVPLTLLFSKSLNAQELGDQIAIGIGVRIQLHRLLLLFISVALAGAAVAFAGGIGFVGLIAPHISRKLVGRSFTYLVPVSFFVGAIIVLLADLVARTLFLPLDLPAGIFVSGIGAPFFIYLLYKNRH